MSSSNYLSYSDTFEATTIPSEIASASYPSHSGASQEDTDDVDTRSKVYQSSAGSHSNDQTSLTCTRVTDSVDRSSRASDTLTYHSDITDTSRHEEDTDFEEGADLYSDTFEESGFPSETVPFESRNSKSYLESVASCASSGNTSGQERKYLEESFDSASGTFTGTYLDTNVHITESMLFGPATEEIRELTEEDLEKAEAFEAHENFVNHWVVKLKKAAYGHQPAHHRAQQPEHKERKHESHDQKKFCLSMIQQMKRKRDVKATTDKKSGYERKTGVDKDNLPVEAYGLDSAVVDRLKLENLIKKMEKFSSEKIHDVKECPQCRQKQQALDEAEAKKCFFQSHVNRLRAKEVDINVENHLIRMTSINLIGEIMHDLPKPTECSDELLYQYRQQILKRINDTKH